MLTKRIIPCLDVDRGRVVKGTNFVGLRDAGDPVEVARRYEAEGADELVFLDISASHEGRPFLLDMIRRVVERCGRPCVFTLTQRHSRPTVWRDLLGYADAAIAAGVPIRPVVAPRAIGVPYIKDR